MVIFYVITVKIDYLQQFHLYRIELSFNFFVATAQHDNSFSNQDRCLADYKKKYFCRLCIFWQDD